MTIAAMSSSAACDSRICQSSCRTSASAALQRIVGKLTQMSFQRLGRTEIAVSTGSEVIQTRLNSKAQRRKPCRLLSLAALNQPQTLPQHFAGVLVTSRLYQHVDQSRLMVSQYDIARRHLVRFQQSRWHNMPSLSCMEPAPRASLALPPVQALLPPL